jgi:translation elongation factor EF-1beta
MCDYLISKKDELQEGIKGKGRLLYLSKRFKHEDVSLFIHTIDPDTLGDFIADHLSKIEHITSTWVINMIKPVFYPLPRDTKNMKRYTITLKVFPKNLKDVYQKIATASLPDGLKMAYIAYTCHLFGDCIQFSILVEKEQVLNEYLSEVVNKIPGVLKTTINLIERTTPLVSYDEWKQYSTEHEIVPTWDEELMVNQFQQ